MESEARPLSPPSRVQKRVGLLEASGNQRVVAVGKELKMHA